MGLKSIMYETTVAVEFAAFVFRFHIYKNKYNSWQ